MGGERLEEESPWTLGGRKVPGGTVVDAAMEALNLGRGTPQGRMPCGRRVRRPGMCRGARKPREGSIV